MTVCEIDEEILQSRKCVKLLNYSLIAILHKLVFADRKSLEHFLSRDLIRSHHVTTSQTQYNDDDMSTDSDLSDDGQNNTLKRPRSSASPHSRLFSKQV